MTEKTKKIEKKTFKKNDSSIRALNKKEISVLKKQGCISEDWSNVYVKNTDITRIKDVSFHGKIKIIDLNGYVEYHNKVKVKASITRATLIDVSISGNVYINNVGRFIANYAIEEGVIIENAGAIYIEGVSNFGNGVTVSPVTEGGGRDVKIFNGLNSHTAYIISLYRHKSIMREKINKMIENYAIKKKSHTGRIKKYAKIINARLIRNVHIDPYAVIENTDEISNATIISTKECPSYIGTSVILIDSIVLKGAHIVDGTLVKKSFIGEGVKLGRQFSCEDSLLFANCEGEHGEMFSIFASPYTVTHHKATLLIASHFSFYNAGSATNQSNHMYKLGPCHHGFMERGCKTGSNSYILWPSYIGAFTTVLGSHYSNIDNSDFPFSYITEYIDHKTRLIPALNLFGAGLCRDETKWKERDRRIGDKNDLIIFDVFTPYTVSKMINAEKILIKMKKDFSPVSNLDAFITYKNMVIKESSLDKYAKRYSLAIDLYLHNKFLSYIEKSKSLKDIKINLYSKEKKPYEKWVDVASLIAPKERIDALIENIEKDKITKIEDLIKAWQDIYDSYELDEKIWVCHIFKNRYDIDLRNIDKYQIMSVLKNHASCLEDASRIFNHDIKKEFDLSKMVSCGIDNEENKIEDFEAVRGSIESNNFVIKYRKDIENKVSIIKDLIDML